MKESERIQLEAYNLIRRKARSFENFSNEEIGSYTKGVVDLQTALYDFDENKVCCVEPDNED